VLREDHHIKLGVVADLGNRGIRQHRPQLVPNGRQIKLLAGAQALVVPYRQVVGHAGLGSEGNAHQLGPHSVGTGGFGIHGQHLRPRQLADQRV